MAKSSINFAKASAGGTKHNDRTQKPEPEYLLPEKYRLKNEVDFSAEEAEQKLKELYETAKENYQKIKKQRLQATSFKWEAVVNLNKNHTIEDVQKLVKKIEKETGFTSVQIAIHRDEGRVVEDNPIYNFHAHITFFTLDQNGEQLYRKTIKASDRRAIEKELIKQGVSKGEPKSKERKAFNELVADEIKARGLKVMDKERLSKLQDLTAEVLGMERGKKGSKTVRLEHRQHREVKKREEKLLAKQKDLKAEIKRIRAELKEQGAVREQYAQLEQLNRDLKEQIKSKDLTIDELKKKLQSPILGAQTNDDKLKKLADKAAELIEAEKTAHKETQKELISARETILKHEATIDTQKELIERLRANISDLEAKVERLGQELKKRAINKQEQIKRTEKRRELNKARQSIKSDKAELSSLINTERSEINIAEVEQFIEDSTGADRRKAKKYLSLRKDFEKFSKYKDRPELLEAEDINLDELEAELLEAEQELLATDFEPSKKNQVQVFNEIMAQMNDENDNEYDSFLAP